MQKILGVFLRFGGTAYLFKYWQRLQSGAQHYGYELREVEVSPAEVYNLIPRILQDGAESWLILHREFDDKEFLILPYPDSELLREGNETYKYPEPLLEIIRGSPNRTWYPRIGYQNLSRNLTSNQPDMWPRTQRFQLIQTTSSLPSLLQLPDFRLRPLDTQFAYDVLQRAGRLVRERRLETLSLSLSEGDEYTRTQLLSEFDNSLVTDNFRLYEHIQSSLDAEIATPEIVYNSQNLLDEETKRFLVSAETVYKFASEHLPSEFDFSLPASGLWKAVERELNLSIVWFLRQRFGIVDSRNPWTGLDDPSKPVKIDIGGRPVNLSQREDKKPSQLRGIMLGPMEYMLRWAYRNGVYEELKRLLPEGKSDAEALLVFCVGPFDKRDPERNTLPNFLEQIRELRNRHAHIEAMSLHQFQRLYHLVLSPKYSPEESFLGKILQVKKVLGHS